MEVSEESLQIRKYRVKLKKESQTVKNNLRVQGTEVRVEVVDLSEISDGKLTKRMFPQRNLGSVYTLSMRIPRKSIKEIYII